MVACAIACMPASTAYLTAVTYVLPKSEQSFDCLRRVASPLPTELRLSETLNIARFFQTFLGLSRQQSRHAKLRF